MATDGFDESKLYWLKDPDTGIIEPHRGVNNYIQQSYEAGVPISKNNNGEWYVTPYLEQTPTGLTAHVPEWFKKTQEYNTWANTYVPQIDSMPVTQDNINSMSDILKSLGNMGFARMAYKHSARGMGVTDESLLDQYVNTMQAIAGEGAGQGDAQISGLFGSSNTYTAAELARKYKEMSKEDLSAAVIKLEENLEAGKNGTFKGSQKELIDSLITLGLLQSVNANPTGYGDGEEFKGLMEASEWQKFQSWLASFTQGIMEGFPILTWGFRLANGIGTAATGGDFLEGFAIEGRRDTIYGANTGLGLEGTEGSIMAGNVTATALNFAGTMAEAVLLGRVTGAMTNGSSLLSSFSGTLGGGMVWDFVAHDIPMDLTLYARDLASGKTASEAWYTEGDTQPLFGLFGPQVPAGLAMNLVGDAIMDLGAPFISMAGGKVLSTVDNLTGGAVGRMRETVKIKNLAIQEKITELPVIGTSIKKFSDFLWGAENANLVRILRRNAIATGDISWYISAQNLLTLKNHAGAEVVAPIYKRLYESTGVMDMVENFRKNANKYGGIGQVKTEWSIAKGGTVKGVSETVVDQLPRQAKEGALIYERLGELKGQVVAEGEIIDNVKRNKEITRLERAYDAMPEEIKQFAAKLSELNKQVEAIGVELGLTTQDWIDALNADPRWTNYMTRQYVMPGGQQGAGALDPTKNKLLTGKRTGFYDQTKVIDPIIALDLKVHAMGNAYAWNERAKVIAASELAAGKIATGGNSIEMAERVKQIRGELMSADATRTKLGYDAVASGYNARISGMTGAINDAAEAMHKLESLAANSTPGQFNQLQSDFEAGKITFADGVKEGAGLSDELAGSIIQNTYGRGGFTQNVKAEAPEVLPTKPMSFDESLSASLMSPRLDDMASGTKLSFFRNPDGEVDFTFFSGLTPGESQRRISVLQDALEQRGRELGMTDAQLAELRKRPASTTYLDSTRVPYEVVSDPEWHKLADYMSDIEDGGPWKVDFSFVDSKESHPFVTMDTELTGFQDLTRGEIRRALITDGYDNLKPEWKRDVNAADNAITQRLSSDTVLIRGESGDADRLLKVGAEFDTAAWTYTSLSPRYTDPFAGGATTVGGTTTTDEIRYRIHAKAGQPVYAHIISPSASEIILPRDAKARITAVAEVVEDGRTLKIVDVDWDPNSGITPLNEQILESVSPKGEAVAAETAPAKAPMKQGSGEVYTSIDSNGVPYKYTIDNNQITSVVPITDPTELADSVSRQGLGYQVTPELAKSLGANAISGINKMQLDYKNAGLFIPSDGNQSFREFNDGSGVGGFCLGTPRVEVVDGRVIPNTEIYLNYRNVSAEWWDKTASRRLSATTLSENDIKTGQKRPWSPENCTGPDYLPKHEGGHDFIKQLAIAEVNRRVATGELDLNLYPHNPDATRYKLKSHPSVTYRPATSLERYIGDLVDTLEFQIVDAAALKLGYSGSQQTRIAHLGDDVTDYVTWTRTHKTAAARNAEIIAESVADYLTNGANAQQASIAVVEEIQKRVAGYQMEANPRQAMLDAGLDLPAGMFKSTGTLFELPTPIKPTNLDYHDTEAVAQILRNYASPYNPKGVITEGDILSWLANSEDPIVFRTRLNLAEGTFSLAPYETSAWDDITDALGLKTGEATENVLNELKRLSAGAGVYNGVDFSNLKATLNERFIDRVLLPEWDNIVNNMQRRQLLGTAQYLFPENVTTNTQKAEWLDGWRQKNPYLIGTMDDVKFQKAQLWDNYFKKEINAYDSNVATSMPTKLMEKTGDFVTKTQQESITKIIDGIKKASGLEDFDSDLATMVLSHNADDMQKAMENLIIRQVDQSAEALAKNMDGGLTPENLNTARVTLWSDLEMKESTIEMIRAWSPQAGVNTDELINNLFDTQAKGFAAYESLPVSTKSMQEEIEALREKIRKENKRAIAVGKKMDKRVDDKYGSYLDGGGHVIHYRDGGEDVYVVSTDPVIASVLQKPYNFKETGVTSQSLTAIANFNATLYRLGTTGINPMSIIRNVLRDPIQAIVTGGFNPISMSLDPTTFYKTLRQYGLDDDTIAKVGEKIKNWANSSTLTQEMKIGNSYWQQSYRTKSEKFAKDLKKLTDTNVIEALQAPLENWESFFRNQIGQQSFMKNLQRTGDVDKAMGLALFDTSNATTNFSHAIAGFKNVTGTVPYLSSAINGTASFWRLYNADPIGMISRLTAGFMVPVMAITAWNLSSEENRAIYETLPEWYREGHLVLVDPSGNVIAFPLPEEIQQFSGTARKLIEYTQEATPYSLPMIAAQGAFGFSPFEMDGFFTDSGEIDIERGIGQLVDGIMPQAATTLYELIREEDLYTGADLSGYSTLNKVVNTLTNVFGTGFKQAINSIGVLCGVGDKIIGQSYGETLARDLFGMGFDNAKNMFMEIVGTKASVDANGKVTKATGLFAEAEKLKDQIKTLDSKIAVTSGAEQAELEAQKEQLINDFTNRVATLMDKYQTMFTVTGGLEAWQKNRLVQLLTLGDAFSSDSATSYSGQAASEAYLNERGLAIQRYVDAGLPAGPSGDFQNSLELQAAINKFYGNSKQATASVTTALKNSGLKELRNQFYDVISQIYDTADANNAKPDYDLIEKIQARYLQAVDDALIPVLNTYGLNILSNNDFINEVRSYVNGMIPSDDWKQSTKNAKKYLSTKEFPTATVDVKKWLQQRYASSMRDRGIASDAEVTTKLQEIVNDINSGKQGAAKGKIESLRNGINKAAYYISSSDYQYLTQLYNMVK